MSPWESQKAEKSICMKFSSSSPPRPLPGTSCTSPGHSAEIPDRSSERGSLRSHWLSAGTSSGPQMLLSPA